MGLFNFIYKLTIIFSNKKKLKVFVVLAIVIILVFAWSKGAFASTPEDDLTIMNYQMVLQQTFTNYLRYWQKNKPSDTYTDARFDTILNRIMFNSVFCTAPTGDPNTELWVYTYIPNSTSYANNPNIFNTDGTYSVGLNSGTQIDCKLGLITPNSFIRLYIGSGTLQVEYNLQNLSDFYMPSACYMVRSTSLDDLLKDFGKYSALNPTYSTSDEELQAIASSGFSSVNNSIQQQTNTMTNSINSASSSISNSINSGVASVTNTLTDDSVSVTSEDLPTDDTTDPTTTGLNSIFTMIQTAFTGTPTAVSFPIPFTNQSFTIQPGFTESSMRKGGLATMVNVIHLYWYYRIYSFIFLKYVELLEHIKEGEFEETVGNIKKEVL